MKSIHRLYLYNVDNQTWVSCICYFYKKKYSYLNLVKLHISKQNFLLKVTKVLNLILIELLPISSS